MTITDDDAAPVISIAAQSVGEGDGDTTLTVTRTGDLSGSSSASYAFSDGTAEGSGTDYRGTSGTVSFAANAGSATIPVSIVQDTIDEGTGETFTVTLSAPSGATLGTASATITITDDDAAPVISIAAQSVGEGAGSATLTVTRTGDLSGSSSADYAFSDGTATSADYTGTSGTVTFAANAASATLPVSIVQDTIDEGTGETFTVTLSSPNGATLGTASATITITDDDAAPVISIAAQSVGEGAGSTTLTVTRTGDLSGTSSASYAFSDGTATGGGTDYRGTSGTVTFAANAASATLPVSIVQDTIDEGTGETFTVTLSSPSGATLGTASATITITDDDAAPVISIAAQSVNEGAGSATLTVTRTGDLSGSSSASYAFSDGTATGGGTDYRGTSGTVTFAANAASATLPVSIVQDTIDEGTGETFTVTLSSPSGATLGTASATITITDDDTAPSVIEWGLASIWAAEEYRRAVLPLVISQRGAGEIKFTVTTVDGSAVSTGAQPDFTATSRRLTHTTAADRLSVVVPIHNDRQGEANETFTVRLSAPDGAELGARTEITVIIEDDDPVPVTINPASQTVTEGTDATVSVTFELSKARSGRATAHWTTVAGTAVAGADYRAQSGRVVFASGETSKTVSVVLKDDEEPEKEEVFSIRLSGAGGLAALPPAAQRSAKVIVADNDTAPTKETLSLTDDDGAPMGITLTLDRAETDQETPVTIPVLANDSDADGDRLSLESTTQPTQGAAAITDAEAGAITYTPNAGFIGEDRFTYTVSDLRGGTATATVMVTVNGVDKPPPTVSILSTVSLPEGNSDSSGAEFGVRLSEASQQRVRVNYETEDGTATAGEDYRATSGTLTFEAGEMRQMIRVLVLGDTRPEEDETFTLKLSGAENAELGVVEGTGTILDDDTAAARARRLDGVLATFGRTAATEAVAMVGDRFWRPSAPGFNLGGRSLSGGESGETAVGLAGPGGYGGMGLGSAGYGLPGVGGAGSMGAGYGLSESGGGGYGGSWQDLGGPGLLGVSEASEMGGSQGAGRRSRTSVAELLSRSSFSLPLTQREKAGEPAVWTLWGRGAGTRFSGSPESDFRTDGGMYGGYLGLDLRPHPRFLLGVAASHSLGELDYTIDSGSQGAVELGLTSVLPYGYWTPKEGLSLWGMLGVGGGQLELEDEVGQVETDAGMRMAAVGGRSELDSWRGNDLALKLDAFLVSMESEGREKLLGAEGEAQRLRVMLESRREWVASGASRLGMGLEFGGRWDGGDAERGLGAEMGGNLKYRHEEMGMGLEARGRYLLTHQAEDFEEWGASLGLEWDPGKARQGPWVKLAPVWGESSGSAEALWRNDRLFGASGGRRGVLSRRPGRMEMNVGYGLMTRGDSDLLTTWGRLSTGMGKTYRMGLSLEMGELGGLSLEVEREERDRNPASHGVRLRSSIRW